VSILGEITVPRPFLKWAGGKSQLLPQYRPYFPQAYKAYFEPFLGGGAVFFHLRPRQAILSDINPELVNVYRCVRDHVQALIDQLEQHQQQHCAEYYYHLRSRTQLPDIERAARLIYLNKTCFNGLYRENSNGEFNVPMGRYQSPAICNMELLQSAALALQDADIHNQPFYHVIQLAQPQDFVYFDPPYHPLSATSNFTAYSRDAFTAADQIQLRDTVLALAQQGVSVMVSNSDCEFVRELYANFMIHTISANRAINSNAQKRGKITELLITSYR
jgi:DNA adenine methylase